MHLLLPSLGVADMQSDRQNSAGQQKRRGGLSVEQKEGTPTVVGPSRREGPSDGERVSYGCRVVKTEET